MYMRTSVHARLFRPRASAPGPLSTLQNASLGWPTSSSINLAGVDLTVQAASAGGHVCLGRNGSGKTLLGSALVHGSEEGSGWLKSGSLMRRDGWSARSTSHVSFESHEALLEEGGSVYRALGVPPGATPTKAAKFLLVRFGLHPLLYRPVTAISTGEIRKVLLARALATRPSLLVLDNAFDGLDVPSREALKELISTTLKGFGQLLVQGVDASATAHTQILMLTHRAEEIVDEISTVSSISGVGGGVGGGGGSTLRTEARGGRSARLLMQAAGGAAGGVGHGSLTGVGGGMAVGGAVPGQQGSFSATAPAGRFPAPPSASELDTLWGRPEPPGTALVEARELVVHRSGATLLGGLEWRMLRGEHWLIAGGNGAGKSTLSRLLARADAAAQGAGGALSVLGTTLTSEAAARSWAPVEPPHGAPPWSPPMEPPRGPPPWAPVAAQPASTSEGGEGEGEAGTRAQEAAGVIDEWGEAKAAAIGAAQHLKRLRLSSSESSASSARPPPPPPPPQREGVGWVSTELHLGMARSTTLACDVLRSSGVASDGDVAAVARWLGLESDLLARPFATLSQVCGAPPWPPPMEPPHGAPPMEPPPWSPLLTPHFDAVAFEQASFYYMGQFSRYLRPGGKRIGLSNTVESEIPPLAPADIKNGVALAFHTCEQGSAVQKFVKADVCYPAVKLGAFAKPPPVLTS